MKDLRKKNCLPENISLVQQKEGKIGDDGKKANGHISVQNYLTCEKVWDKFDIKDMGDYHYHYLKKDVLLLAGVFETFIDTCLYFMDVILVIVLVLLD